MLVDTRRQNISTLTNYKGPYESVIRRCLYTRYSASWRDPFKINVRHRTCHYRWTERCYIYESTCTSHSVSCSPSYTSDVSYIWYIRSTCCVRNVLHIIDVPKVTDLCALRHQCSSHHMCDAYSRIWALNQLRVPPLTDINVAYNVASVGNTFLYFCGNTRQSVDVRVQYVS